jgi:type II secretory pathway pseudopilin PulG
MIRESVSQSPIGNRTQTVPRVAITLTEVVVGLALMGSLLTIMLVGAGRLERQRSAAEAKLEAVAALDLLISGFFSNGFPALPSEGALPVKDGWMWTMSRVNIAAPEGCTVTRFAIVDLRKANDLPNDNTINEPNRVREIATIDVLIADTAFGQNKLAGLQP